MAEENHDGIAEMLSSLQDNENSSTLLPTLTSHENDNSDQSSNPKPDVNLQLSLGGFYDKTPNSAPALPTSFANPGNSVLKRSYFEQNKFMRKEGEEIKITREVQVITKTKNQEGGSAETSENEKSEEVKTLVSPLDIPVWAAQSASENPAFQRALNVIKSEASLNRIPRSRNTRGETSKKPHANEGFGSQLSILYQALKNGKPIATHINYGTNQRPVVPQKQSEYLNLVAPPNFSDASGNGISNQQLQNVKFVSPFNYSLAIMDRLPHWSTDETLTTHSNAPAFVPSSSGAKISSPFPASSGTRGNNISIVPQNATGYDKSSIPSNVLSNSKAAAMAAYPFPPFLPTSSCTNANGNSFMPPGPNRPFAGPGVTPIPLPEVINGSRVYHNSMNPPENSYKRARHDNRDIGEAEPELMKQLPTVVTTGGNPNGKKTEGLLYKYGSDQEVIIICACHGCFFSPEEFVRHAGGGDVENPRQEISVLSYPDYLMKLDHTGK